MNVRLSGMRDRKRLEGGKQEKEGRNDVNTILYMNSQII